MDKEFPLVRKFKLTTPPSSSAKLLGYNFIHYQPEPQLFRLEIMNSQQQQQDQQQVQQGQQVYYYNNLSVDNCIPTGNNQSQSTSSKTPVDPDLINLSLPMLLPQIPVDISEALPAKTDLPPCSPDDSEEGKPKITEGQKGQGQGGKNLSMLSEDNEDFNIVEIEISSVEEDEDEIEPGMLKRVFCNAFHLFSVQHHFR